MSSMFSQFGAGLKAYDAPVDARVAFVRRTYVHLAGAIAAFVGLSSAAYSFGVGRGMLEWMQGSRFGWLMFLGAFVAAGWLASSMAHNTRSRGAQYFGLGLYTVMEAFIFAPIIYLAATIPQFEGILPTAAGITLLTFGGLSGYAIVTKKDFSFLRMFLVVGGFAALGVIVLGTIFGWSLGVWFSGAMILFASGAILYSTSRVLHEFRTDQHVGAALELFAAVALLFYYVLMLLMQLSGRRD